MTEIKEQVVVRFPPSPTGNLHIGNIRTFLFSYLFARKHNGKIVMRFEDTDRERSKKEFETVALETLEKLGLDFDEGPFWQSQRTERYIEVLNNLISKGLAYEGEERKDGSGERVVRIKNPNKEITFHDIIRGDITIDTTDFGDFVIARSKTSPLYHLTVVVDDIDMGITHVIRGEDHITSTPRQMLLIEALGGAIPQYAHLPLIVGADKKKLGKRHGAVTYQEFEQMGILPEAVINYLALLGWNPGDDREFFTMSELIQEFSLERINNSPAMFSYDKLDSINRHHMLKLSDKDFEEKLARFLPEWLQAYIDEYPDKKQLLVHEVIKERIAKFADIASLAERGEFDYLRPTITYDIETVVWKKGTKEDAKQHLSAMQALLSQVSEAAFTKDAVKDAVWEYVEEHGRGDTLWPFRMVLTGAQRSPDPFTVAHLLGKTRTLERMQNAIDAL